MTKPLEGVTGGEDASLATIDHGLGRKDDMVELLSAKAQQQGIDDYTLSSLIKDQPDTPVDSTNLIAMPLRQFLDECAEKTLGSFYSTKDPGEREAEELADKAVKETLKELVAQDAILFIPPDEYTMVRKQLENVAEAMIKESKALAREHCKKLSVTEETVKHRLRNDMKAKKFRDRHNALFHPINAANEAPETGIAPVARIDGRYGSIGAEHGLCIGLPLPKSS